MCLLGAGSRLAVADSRARRFLSLTWRIGLAPMRGLTGLIDGDTVFDIVDNQVPRN